MFKTLLLGNTGQLGWEALRVLAPLGEITGLDYPEIDFTRPEQLVRKVFELRPQIIFNAAAYTAVDRAENEKDLARQINAVAPGALAETASRLGAVLVHFSTDYVFDGKKGCAYVESDTPNPLNEYGGTKLEGERAIRQVDCAHLIFRTSWVYSTRRDSFVTKVLEWAASRPSIRVVSDQIGNPTWARMLAQITGVLLSSGGSELPDWVNERRGMYHLAGDGYTSRMDWAKEILKHRQSAGFGAAQTPVEVLPALTSEFPTPAERPLFSALDCSLFARTFGLRLPPWEQSLQWAMEG
jgi:dTDP-4-dehydrorhamnose reductase